MHSTTKPPPASSNSGKARHVFQHRKALTIPPNLHAYVALSYSMHPQTPLGDPAAIVLMGQCISRKDGKVCQQSSVSTRMLAVLLGIKHCQRRQGRTRPMRMTVK